MRSNPMPSIQEDQIEPIYTPQGLATLWGVHKQTVLTRINKGQLDAFSIGGLYRIRQSAVNNFERDFAVTALGKRQGRRGKKKAGEDHPAPAQQAQRRARPVRKDATTASR